jgi:single-stranded-DNA-specific exonuclease
MLQAKTKWLIGDPDESVANRISKEYKVDGLLARLLVSRGIVDPDRIDEFLRGGLKHLFDPFRMKGMQEAVARIRMAIERQQKIRVYGDYDADGICSTTLMIFLLNRLGAKFDYYIPHRIEEGYGLNCGAMDEAKRQGVELIITVDTGISAWEEIEYASRAGLDVVVTDHHEPPEKLPDAVAVVNPHQPGCEYPFKSLAGAGVAFKLAQALLGEPPLDLLEYAAIGTIADLMPLVGENRLFAKLGLERMRETTNLGLKALLDVAGIDRVNVSAGHIGFQVGPRINASGRLESAVQAVRLLTTTDEEEARELAYNLDALNRQRQELVEGIVAEAVAQLEVRMAAAGAAEELPKVIVLAQEGWNAGVIGIVASRVLDKYYRPTIILSIDPETGQAKGSARSIAGFDLYKSLTECADCFTHYGGHKAAAGMTLPVGNIASLDARLNELAEEWLSPDDFVPCMRADMLCPLEFAQIEQIEQLDGLAPFGMNNPTPRFVFNDLQLTGIKRIGRDQQHLRLTLSQPSAEVGAGASARASAAANAGTGAVGRADSVWTIEAIGFGLGELAGEISPSARIDVLGELSVNEWNGMKKTQIMIQDLRIRHMQVFDWRGLKQPFGRLAELAGSLRSVGRAGTPGLVVVNAEQYAELQQRAGEVMDRFAVWTLDSAGQASALNEPARTAAVDELETVVVYNLPPNSEALSRFVQTAGNVTRWYAIFGDPAGGGTDSINLPSRDMFKKLYSALQQLGVREVPLPTLMEGLRRKLGFSPASIRFMLEVFEELQFVGRGGDNYGVLPNPAKRDLSESAKYRARGERDAAEQIFIYTSTKELTDWFLGASRTTTAILEGVR